MAPSLFNIDQFRCECIDIDLVCCSQLLLCPLMFLVCCSRRMRDAQPTHTQPALSSPFPTSVRLFTSQLFFLSFPRYLCGRDKLVSLARSRCVFASASLSLPPSPPALSLVVNTKHQFKVSFAFHEIQPSAKVTFSAAKACPSSFSTNYAKQTMIFTV